LVAGTARPRHARPGTGDGARHAPAAAGCALRFPPRCSPDFNPRAPGIARVKEAPRRPGTRSFAAVASADARGRYRALGYPIPKRLV
jgi:hypothetical protein